MRKPTAKQQLRLDRLESHRLHVYLSSEGTWRIRGGPEDVKSYPKLSDAIKEAEERLGPYSYRSRSVGRLQRRHFEFIASTLFCFKLDARLVLKLKLLTGHDVEQEARYAMATQFTERLYGTNANFNRSRFMKAATGE